VGVQVIGELTQRLGQLRAVERIVFTAAECRGRGLDGVEIRGKAKVIRLQPLNGWGEGGVGAADRREEMGILDRVVGMYEPAIGETVDPEFPKWTLGLETMNGGAHVVGRSAIADPFEQTLHGVKIPPDHGMHPEQLSEETLGAARVGVVHR
jgi:hypothetical protein